MFEIPQPSMALNAVDVPPPPYRMWNTFQVGVEQTAESILSNCEAVAKSAVDHRLRCLVFNSHGRPGHMKMGRGIGRDETPLFSKLSDRVHTIFLVECEIAAIGNLSAGDGNLFCCEIAKNAHAYVFAGTATQNAGAYWLIGIPPNCIDEFEGKVYRWAPDGSCREVDNDYIGRWVRRLKIGQRPEEWR